MKLIIMSRKNICFKPSTDFPKKANGLYYSNQELMCKMINKAEELGVVTSNMEYLIDKSLQYKDSQFMNIPVKRLRKVNVMVLICANTIDEMEEFENVFKYSDNDWQDKIINKSVEELGLPFSDSLSEPNFKKYKLGMLNTYKLYEPMFSYVVDGITTVELKNTPRYLVKTAANELYWLDEGMDENESENLIMRWERCKDGKCKTNI